MRLGVRLLVVGLAFGRAPVAAAQVDSAGSGPRPPLIRPIEAAAAVGAIAAAALIDGTVRDRSQAERSVASNEVASVGNAFGHFFYVGPALAAGWVTGRILGDSRIMGATAKAAAAGVVAGAITGALKVGFGRVRPRDGLDPMEFHPFSSNASFPSGHTTLAMAIATSLAHSTPDGWTDIAFYGAAAVTGFARINDNKHWLSDVVGGAAIGYLVGRQITERRGRIRPLAGPGAVGVTLTF
ncbi:MAG: phosphatase PAP2 family protein [Gemmatimonadales bacterium]|nr:phosphatase PAP2 family protein [Gemmatimonadales bacterium]